MQTHFLIGFLKSDNLRKTKQKGISEGIGKEPSPLFTQYI